MQVKEVKSRKRPQINRFSLNQGNDDLRSSLVLCYFFSTETFQAKKKTNSTFKCLTAFYKHQRIQFFK